MLNSVVHCTARMVNKKRSDSLSKIWGFLAILIHEMRVHLEDHRQENNINDVRLVQHSGTSQQLAPL
jgi:hypothetical protein